MSLVSHLRRADAHNRAAINLVPSETRLSPLAQLPLSTDFYNRYFFNEALARDFWQFRGGQQAHGFETDVARESLLRLASARHVNVRPISGMSAMMIAISGLAGEQGNTVVTVAEESGGHYATRGLAERLGYRSSTVTVQDGRVNATELVGVLTRSRVSLVYLDLQNSLHVLDVAAVAQVIRQSSPSTLLHVDCSHTLGLVLGQAIANPLDHGADSMGGSTHKSFPGPHKGVLFTNGDDLAQRLKEAQMKLLSSHHFAETMALGLAAAEFEQFGPAYAAAIVDNARSFAKSLDNENFEVVRAGIAFTDTHQVWVHVGDDHETMTFAERLYGYGIRVNVETDLPGRRGAILRLGVNEMTFEGANADSMTCLASTFAYARAGSATRCPSSIDIRDTFGEPYYYDGDEMLDILRS